ncbi:hypothetical protein SK128_018131, partial [Halocaridina rubra]
FKILIESEAMRGYTCDPLRPSSPPIIFICSRNKFGVKFVPWCLNPRSTLIYELPPVGEHLHLISSYILYQIVTHKAYRIFAEKVVPNILLNLMP